MGEYVKIDALGEDAVFPVYVAAPSGSARAAIIVIPEIFGVNAGIRQMLVISRSHPISSGVLHRGWN